MTTGVARVWLTVAEHYSKNLETSCACVHEGTTIKIILATTPPQLAEHHRSSLDHMPQNYGSEGGSSDAAVASTSFCR